MAGREDATMEGKRVAGTRDEGRAYTHSGSGLAEESANSDHMRPDLRHLLVLALLSVRDRGVGLSGTLPCRECCPLICYLDARPCDGE